MPAAVRAEAAGKAMPAAGSEAAAKVAGSVLTGAGTAQVSRGGNRIPARVRQRTSQHTMSLRLTRNAKHADTRD